MKHSLLLRQSLVRLAAMILGIALFCPPASPMAAGSEADRQETLANTPVELNAEEKAEVDRMVLPVPPNWIGDFDGMEKRKTIRVLVPYNKTYFYVDRGQQMGIDYEFGKALEQWMNKNHPLKGKSHLWSVYFIPVRRDQLLPDLLAGKGDIAGGGLTVTPGRMETVDFAAPIVSGVREAVVTGPDSPRIEKIDDLSGQEVMVRASSSYFEHLIEINKDFEARGLKAIKIVPLDESLESEDILEMVNAGLIKITVVDRYLAAIWKPLYTDLHIQDNFYLTTDNELAWAIRKGSPKLESVLAAFMKQHKVGTNFGNMISRRYAYDEKRVLNSTSEDEMRKFMRVVGYFRTYAQKYDFDFLMIGAQGFQESRLNQNQRSPKGAVGIMQMLPSTAADPAIGIAGIEESAERNIEAGTKYLRLLADKYLNEPELTPVDRALMAFAAYNAGPGNLRKFRRLAEKSGKNPNVWFQNVEYGAAMIVGRETVTYVSNIYKYYLAYKLALTNRKLGRGGPGLDD